MHLLTKTCYLQFFSFDNIAKNNGGVIKKRMFYSHAEYKVGGGVSPLGQDRKEMWKFWPTKKGLKSVLDQKHLFFGHTKENSQKADR